jgi:hypothetical protein
MIQIKQDKSTITEINNYILFLLSFKNLKINK